MKSKKPKEAAPDWASIAASRQSEIDDLKLDLASMKVEMAVRSDNLRIQSAATSRVEDALDLIEPECHRRDVKGVEVVTLVRRALEGGSDE